MRRAATFLRQIGLDIGFEREGRARTRVIRPGGGDRAKSEEQPHAKRIAHAFEPALPSPDAGRDAMPIARDGERALSDARRPVARRAEGE